MAPPVPAPFETLRRLLGEARAGALFPDAAALDVWLRLVELPGREQPQGTLTPHASGFPGPTTLEVLHRLQAAARTLAAEERRTPRAPPDGLARALLDGRLPPRFEAAPTLVARERGGGRLLLVVDALDLSLGCPVRFTVRLRQRRGGHFAVGRDGQVTLSPALAERLESLVAASAEAWLLALRALDGLEVEECVRGQLGPAFAPSRRCPWPGLAAVFEGPGPAEGALALGLERAGPGVAKAFDGHPFAPLDRSPAAEQSRELFGYRVARELRLVCTPGLLEPLKSAVAGRPVVVRAAAGP